jgi:hypothetical protein
MLTKNRVAGLPPPSPSPPKILQRQHRLLPVRMIGAIVAARKQAQKRTGRTHCLVHPSGLQKRHKEGARPSLAVDGAFRVEFYIREPGVFQKMARQPLAMFIKSRDIKPVVEGRFRFRWKPELSNWKPVSDPDSLRRRSRSASLTSSTV